MIEFEDDATEIEDAKEQAQEFLRLAILQFLTTQDHDPVLKLTGLELALLHCAAQMAMVLKNDCGVQFTKAAFGSLARLEYADVAKYRTKKQKPKPKVRHLKVVK